MSLLSKAIKIAVDAHEGQVDKAGKAYILHPLKVMHYIKSSDEELMAIAVLHDVIEDCKSVTYKALLEAGMSTRVLEGVASLTKLPGEDYDGYKHRVKLNKDAVIVKMADLRHNSDIRRLKGVTEKDIKRTVKYHEFYLELQSL